MVLGMISVFMVVEVVVGLQSKSLALLADAGHMLTDVAAQILALVAFWFSAKPPTTGKTYGYYRTEILAGLINGVLLVSISVFILIESYQRLINPPEVHGMPVLVVACFGLIINLVSAKLLGNLAKDSINVKAAYLEILSDLMATAGVIVSSIIVLMTGWNLADPIVSGLIGIMILPRTWMLLKECTNVLMEGTPDHVNLEDLKVGMLSIPGVVSVHDIHVWSITSALDAMSGHVAIEPGVDSDGVLEKLTKLVQDEFAIKHTTIQIERSECAEQDRCT
jgi:cobalt-zinc-cadmium efflux system protein